VTTTIRRSFAALCVLVALTGATACSDGDDEAADFCKKFRTYEDANENLVESDVQNAEDLDLDDVHSRFSRLADQLSELQGTAPDDIEQQVGTVKTAFDTINEDIQAAESPQELFDVLQDLAANKKADTAGDAVDDWANDNCDSEGDTKN
jgi:hypothetical protein